MAVLTVGVGQQYTTVASAVAATKDGDTVLVQAGLYLNDFFSITHKITLQSVGGLAILQATASPPNGKAIITTGTDAVIDGFGFTGASVPDANGAGIRYEGGNLVVRNSVFWDNQEGLLSAPDPNGTIVIENSEFSHNGAGDGYSHNIYVGAIASVVIKDSYFHDSIVGHEIKSRAYQTTIINNRIQDNIGNGSYDIDLPNGGVGIIQGNVIEKGANAENYTAIHFGGEGTPYAVSSLAISDNTIVSDNPSGVVLNNATTTPVTFTSNRLWGFAAENTFHGGPVVQSGTSTLAARPTLDLSTRAPDVKAAPAVPTPVVADVPITAVYTTFGTAGAVAPIGHVLTVGGRGSFQSLSSALAAAKDGDTIQVAAGTYVNDFGTVNRKVIIEGVGGIARFVQKDLGFNAPAGILTVNTDATLRNLEFSGGHLGANGHEGGITVNAGNVTIVNTQLDDNDSGITAADNADTTISIYGSEINGNGNWAKATHNVAISRIGSFTLQNSYVHDAVTGHEVWDRAYNTDIENNRIMDGPTVQASFLIGLGQGGHAVISNNILEKGLNSVNDNLVLVGGEGPIYSNTGVQINNNTLVSDMVQGAHPYTYFLTATADATAVGPVTANNNTFIGGIPGSAQTSANIVATGGKVASSATLDTSSPVSAALAPAIVSSPAGANTLTVKLGEAKGLLDAQFTVAMDGVTIGGGVVTAAQSSNSPQVFTFNGWWPQGNHVITIAGLNLLYGATSTYGFGAQSLTVDGINLDGRVYVMAKTLDSFTPSMSLRIGGTTKLPDFDAAYYLAHNPGVAASGMDPLTHYMTTGWKQGLNPNALFDTKAYLAANPDVAAANMNPLFHFEAAGWSEGRVASAWFNNNWYLQQNPDVAAAKMDPLLHYDTYGWKEGRAANPYFSDTAYVAAHPEAAATGMDPMLLFLNSSEATATPQASHYLLPEAAAFDVAYYLAHNPDVAAAGVDPLIHYEQYGWHEGRDPSAGFSTNKYLATYADVKAANMDPLYHYTNFGTNEGRQALAV